MTRSLSPGRPMTSRGDASMALISAKERKRSASCIMPTSNARRARAAGSAGSEQGRPSIDAPICPVRSGRTRACPRTTAGCGSRTFRRARTRAQGDHPQCSRITVPAAVQARQLLLQDDPVPVPAGQRDPRPQPRLPQRRSVQRGAESQAGSGAPRPGRRRRRAPARRPPRRETEPSTAPS